MVGVLGLVSAYWAPWRRWAVVLGESNVASWKIHENSRFESFFQGKTSYKFTAFSKTFQCHMFDILGQLLEEIGVIGGYKVSYWTIALSLWDTVGGLSQLSRPLHSLVLIGYLIKGYELTWLIGDSYHPQLTGRLLTKRYHGMR